MDKVKAKHMIYMRCEQNQPRLSAWSTNAETQNKSYNLCMTDLVQGAKLPKLPKQPANFAYIILYTLV